MRIILIPGLGYDDRIFHKLQLTNIEIEYLNWIEPLKNEHIHDYAQRLFATAKPSSQKTILIGHSLGGVVSQEIASVHQIEKVILISSITARKEIPWTFKIVKPLRLDRFFTKTICVKSIPFWGKSHGFNTETTKLFKSMIQKQTNSYLQWALRALSTWKAPKIPATTKIIRIHGTNDKTLPYKLVSTPELIIENGSHIAVITEAEKISEFLQKNIQN
ncbi:alpha/beta hydrolase [Kordia jejudonensis]|uniref:alpha/beta hydrolase n=1 Tax=Kordia jejudonensis TaxID=1348245 RepID=UPI0006296D70|nr:alpha/beta hydrolase [Kordia jejudonensis]